MNPFAVHLDRSRQLAHTYNVPDWILDSTDLDMSGMPDHYRHILETETLAAAVLSTANAHKTECIKPVCDTCDNLRDAVALAYIVIRAEAHRDLELPPPRTEQAPGPEILEH